MVGHHHRASPLCRPPAGRHHRMLSSVLSLSFLAWSGESLSLVLPGRRCLWLRNAPAAQPHELLRSNKRRRRRALELRLRSSSDRDGACRATSNSSPLPNGGCRAIDGRFGGPTSRPHTSLSMMAHGSDSAGGGFGKGDDKKKKRENNGGDAGGSPKPKAGKGMNMDRSAGRPSGVAKGSSAPGDDGGDRKTKKNATNDGAKRTRSKDEKKSNKKQNNDKNSRAKAKANETSTPVDAGRGSIKSSDENTSLRGFKSEKKPTPPPRRSQGGSGNPTNDVSGSNDVADDDMKKRIVRLETIISNQLTEIQKLRRDVDGLTRGAGVFSKVVDVLRKAGIQIDEEDQAAVVGDDRDEDEVRIPPTQPPAKRQAIRDDMEIFGIAPNSVTDAADTAGASMLSAILAGKHRMLVDVRDAELTRDPKLLVEFIELAILPVAAGLEGLDSVRNRVKIVFPTVKELMSYRKSMALAAPEVVSLSTLGFEPVDERDNLIVVVAPSPDDAAGVAAMEKLIARTDKNYVEPDRRITQPVVVMNHHMVPVHMAGFGKFTTVYHLRLLSVQYMTGYSAPEFVAQERPPAKAEDGDESMDDAESAEEEVLSGSGQKTPDSAGPLTNRSDRSSKAAQDKSEEEDEALEAAMTHAHEIGFHQGVTRAMVIRAYPK
jgi:hypothetical protein